MNEYPTEAIANATLSNRKIGLGVMGFAELCILLGVAYASNEATTHEATTLAMDLMRFIMTEARHTSTHLAEDRGVFPNWAQSVHANSGLKLRNATLTSTAPTGAISIIGGTSSNLRKLFITALEVAPEHHVRIQAVFQQHVDNAVSKTVNLPHDATPQDVAHVYQLSHRLGTKGVTVFRYGSRAEQVLEIGLNEPFYEREHFAKCDPGACKL
jgi:ribonucleoside-diphosphate reductase alpha chain